MTARKPAKKPRAYRRSMWGGFVDGRLYLWHGKPIGGQTAPAIFTKWSDAKEHYQDVRRVEIREVKK